MNNLKALGVHIKGLYLCMLMEVGMSSLKLDIKVW